MVRLIPMIYRNTSYPSGIRPRIREIPAHFDKEPPSFISLDYSLHTEYAYHPRKFNSPACQNLTHIINARDKNGIPRLWFNRQWTNEFVRFIRNFVGVQRPPKIIEIHPPFDDYMNIHGFIDLYKHFENQIKSIYPNVEILIENRYGSQYSGGEFIVSKVDDLKTLVDLIKRHGLELRIALDIPQLFSAHGLSIGRFSTYKIKSIFRQLYAIREYIMSIHLWGKCLGRNNRIVSHVGTFDSYFGGLKCQSIGTNPPTGNMIKRVFLEELYNLFDDGKERYFLPEVNNRSHLRSIVLDLINAGFKFV